MQELKKIVIIGPESTGKSTLCTQLAAHYHTLWSPEYAREYLLRNGTDYGFEDLLEIAKGQLEMEDENALRVMNLRKEKDNNNPPMLFIDTDMYVMKVWSEFVFEKEHEFINAQIATRKYDLYLLCNTDLPWMKDELREYPDLDTRNKLFSIYKNILESQDTPWALVSGGYENRLQDAVQAVNKFIFL